MKLPKFGKLKPALVCENVEDVKRMNVDGIAAMSHEDFLERMKVYDAQLQEVCELADDWHYTELEAVGCLIALAAVNRLGSVRPDLLPLFQPIYDGLCSLFLSCDKAAQVAELEKAGLA